VVNCVTTNPIERLAQVEAAGVHLVLCSTCLDYYGLTGKVRVGLVGGMTDILEAQAKAARVISL